MLGSARDALFDLGEALVCADRPVRSLVGLSRAREHRRGHGSLYDALNQGRIEIEIRWHLARAAIPRIEGRIVLAVDASAWLRPQAWTSPQRRHCHTFTRSRSRKGGSQMVPGWPYSIVAALEAGRSSWTAPLDVVRVRPGDDETQLTADQVRGGVTRLIAAGRWRPGDPTIRIVMDAGYDVVRLAHLLADLPVVLIGRVRADRVMLHRPAPPQRGKWGRPAGHGPVMALARPQTHTLPDHHQVHASDRCGTITVTAWNRLHPRLTRRGPWADHPGGKFAPCRSSRAP